MYFRILFKNITVTKCKCHSTGSPFIMTFQAVFQPLDMSLYSVNNIELPMKTFPRKKSSLFTYISSMYSFVQKYDKEKEHKQLKHLMMIFDFHYPIEYTHYNDTFG